MLLPPKDNMLSWHNNVAVKTEEAQSSILYALPQDMQITFSSYLTYFLSLYVFIYMHMGGGCVFIKYE